VPVFISPRNRVAQLYPQALGSLFVASYDSQGCGGGIRTRLAGWLLNCCWSLSAKLFLVSSPTRLMTIFYWLPTHRPVAPSVIAMASTAQKPPVKRIPSKLSDVLSGLLGSKSPGIVDEGACVCCRENVFTCRCLATCDL
jgi:hypothetical protein